MRPAIVSGIVTVDAPVSYWPIVFISLVAVPEVFVKTRPSSLLCCKVANLYSYLLMTKPDSRTDQVPGYSNYLDSEGET